MDGRARSGCLSHAVGLALKPMTHPFPTLQPLAVPMSSVTCGLSFIVFDFVMAGVHPHLVRRQHVHHLGRGDGSHDGAFSWSLSSLCKSWISPLAARGLDSPRIGLYFRGQCCGEVPVCDKQNSCTTPKQTAYLGALTGGRLGYCGGVFLDVRRFFV